MEQAIVMGHYEHLLGIWSAPASCNGNTAVIMVTAGMLHHAGPFRLHVDLARGLSAKGIPSLRFDLSGIGESFGVGVGGRSLDRAADEIGQAIDWLAAHHGITNVILFGLCSGADDAIAVAMNDPRIVGVIAMDGCGYRTPKYYWHRFKQHYLPRMLKPTKWHSMVRRRFHRNHTPTSLTPGDDIREFPTRDVAESEIASLIEQGTWLHFVYTSGVGDYYNHSAQFAEMFPRLKESSSVSTRFFPEMDHVAFLCEDRETLVDHVTKEIAAKIVRTEEPVVLQPS
ncbi:Alpha/beta hydrolase family protein [Planctomycetes bacterium CA13]|uniref:Alpha/beta hydrolase family protein n=1 Tax=Novipirellula herctigrandis TaxID=2527986 RepID=A0A5C5Z7E6_9BACT|nr:Alpha/beta hydrolase family protein [Planctomycetes bacterium CA13]